MEHKIRLEEKIKAIIEVAKKVLERIQKFIFLDFG